MSKCEYCKKEHIDENTGCNNSGYFNSGDRNSGDRNSGDCNSGYRNSGYRNSGYCNSGYRNSGYCNSGDFNSGWFNTDEPNMRFFNQESDIKFSDFSVEVYPDLKICSWVGLDNLPESEKTESARQMGGVLKTLTYKEAWAEYWGRASDSDKEWFQNLPNFTWKVFTSITGINVTSKEEMIEIDGKKVSKSTVKEALKAFLKDL